MVKIQAKGVKRKAQVSGPRATRLSTLHSSKKPASAASRRMPRAGNNVKGAFPQGRRRNRTRPARRKRKIAWVKFKLACKRGREASKASVRLPCGRVCSRRPRMRPGLVLSKAARAALVSKSTKSRATNPMVKSKCWSFTFFYFPDGAGWHADCQGMRGDILSNDSASARDRALAQLDGRPQHGVAADESPGADLGRVLLLAIEIAGDRPCADVYPGTKSSISDIGKMPHLGARAEVRVLDFAEIAHVHPTRQVSALAQVRVGTDIHPVFQHGFFDHRGEHFAAT